MRISAGTSGFSYKEWRGTFYPEKMKEADMLEYYATKFDTVELNNTFYRLPNEQSLRSWASQVPEGFRFALKASRTITHIKRLKECAEPVSYLLRSVEALGPALGPILFGLPPNMKCDVDRLAAFLAFLPPGVRSAFEFRHESWLCDEVYDLLRMHDCALCIADTEEHTTPFVATTSWGYLRLRRVSYTEADLVSWRRQVEAQEWSEALVYFKHEDAGTGPRLAQSFLAQKGQT